MRSLPLALIGVLATTAVFAQAAPPPPPAGAPPSEADVGPPPPPPPGDARGVRPPPPPGAHVMIDRGPNGVVRIDVRCAERDTSEACAAIATALLDKVAGPTK